MAQSTIEIQPDVFKNAHRFSIWQGIEPDKWATLWMIKRYIVTDAYFLLVPPNTGDIINTTTPMIV